MPRPIRRGAPTSSAASSRPTAGRRNRLATLAYDGVALAGHLARLKPGGDFSAEAITNPNGWSGVDGIFRFLPDGRSERALAVIEVQGDRGMVVSPAPTTFAAPDELSDMPALPRAILFDLDDTLIRAYAQPEDAWRRLLHVFAAHLDAHDAAAIERVRVAVMEEARAFWSDQAAAAKWRLDIPGARRLSVRRGLARLGHDDEALADRIADAFTEMRRDEYRLYPDAHATVDACARPASSSPWSPTARPRRSATRSCASISAIASIISRSRASSARASPSSPSIATRWSGWAARPATPGWSATTTNGKSWRRRSSACAASGTTRSTPACRRTPPAKPTRIIKRLAELVE